MLLSTRNQVVTRSPRGGVGVGTREIGSPDSRKSLPKRYVSILHSGYFTKRCRRPFRAQSAINLSEPWMEYRDNSSSQNHWSRDIWNLPWHFSVWAHLSTVLKEPNCNKPIHGTGKTQWGNWSAKASYFQLGQRRLGSSKRTQDRMRTKWWGTSKYGILPLCFFWGWTFPSKSAGLIGSDELNSLYRLGAASRKIDAIRDSHFGRVGLSTNATLVVSHVMDMVRYLQSRKPKIDTTFWLNLYFYQYSSIPPLAHRKMDYS